MFNNLNSAKKLKLLGAAVAVAFILVYFVAIRETIHAASDCKAKELRLKQSKELDQSMVLLKNEIRDLDKQIGTVGFRVQFFGGSDRSGRVICQPG